MKKRKVRKSRKVNKNLNRNPYQNWDLESETEIHGVKVRVAYQNAGMTWFTPTKEEEEFSKDQPDKFLLRGLIVFQARTDGSIQDCYRWNGR